MEQKIYAFVLGLIQHYNHDTYWKMRQEVVNPKSKKASSFGFGIYTE